MKKLAILTIIIGVMFIIGCSGDSENSGFLGLLIGGVCDSLPIPGFVCDGLELIFGVAEGTIKVHNINGNWVTLTSEPMQFNLLQSSSKQQVMTFNSIPPGRYDKIMIDLEKIEIITPDKTYNAIILNNELIIDTNIIVDRNKKSLVELNLDLANSLYMTTEGEMVFAPVIDIKSKKDVDVQEVSAISLNSINSNTDVLTYNQKQYKIKNGTLVESKSVGMNLDGKIKKDFVLNRNVKLSMNNNRIEIVKPNAIKLQPKLEIEPVREIEEIVETEEPEEQSVFSTVIVKSISNNIEIGEKAKFRLMITNNADESQEYSIYSLQSGQGWNVDPNPLSNKIVQLRPGEIRSIIIEAQPLEEFESGLYYPEIAIESRLHQIYTLSLKVYLTKPEAEVEEYFQEVTIYAKKWLFNPETLTLEKDKPVKLTIIPYGVDFTFSIPSMNVEKEIRGNTVIEFTPNFVGEYGYKCSSCEDWRGMIGNLIVSELTEE